jgi:hypothetical protein
MRRVLVALVTFYRRWRYVEDVEAVPTGAAAAESGEAFRIRKAIEREEARIADCRRNGRQAMARERETTLRSLKNRLAALEMGGRRTA